MASLKSRLLNNKDSKNLVNLSLREKLLGEKDKKKKKKQKPEERNEDIQEA